MSTVGLATGDPCAVDTVATWGNVASNSNRGQVQALCRAIIGNGTSGFDTRPGGPGTYVGPFGFFAQDNAIISGNRKLESEEASTWTAGVVMRAPSEAALLQNLSLSVDFYNVKITNGSSTEPLVMLKHFNPGNVEMPRRQTHLPDTWFVHVSYAPPPGNSPGRIATQADRLTRDTVRAPES